MPPPTEVTATPTATPGSSMQPLQVDAAGPAAAHEETMPEALVTGRPPVGLGELQPGAAATASTPDAVGLGYTQMERRKQLAIQWYCCLLYTSPSPRDKRQSRMPSSA